MRDPKTGKFIKGVDFSGRLPHNLAVSNNWVRDLELEMYKPSLEATRRPRTNERHQRVHWDWIDWCWLVAFDILAGYTIGWFLSVIT